MAYKLPLRPKLGDYVKIRYGPNIKTQIIEDRGLLGPKGERVWRIRIDYDPDPHFVEILEEQIEAIVIEP
jgi:hypothetical protein